MKTFSFDWFGYFAVLFAMLSITVRAGEEDAMLRGQFREAYTSWRADMKRSSGAGLYDTKSFQAMVRLGPPVLPIVFEKMADPSDPLAFHMCAVAERIAKTLGRYETLGISSNKEWVHMWLKWWKDDRFQTGERFAELHGKWKSLKAEKKDKEAEETYQRIVDLGIPVLPYLLDKVEQQTEFVPAISKLSAGAVDPRATAIECKNWWEKNKQKFELPKQSVSKQSSDNK